jgi:DNA polymerase I
MIEFDCETRGLQWYYPSHEMFLAQFYDPDNPLCWGPEGEPEPVILRHPEDREQIQAWLDRCGKPDSGVRAWNSKFDLHMAEAAGYHLPPQSCWHDGMVVRRILDERVSMGLQATGDSIFGKEPWPVGAGAELEKAVKEWLAKETAARRKACKASGERLVKPNYSDVPDDIMYPYAGHDVLLQRRIMDVLEPKLEEATRLPEVYDLERGVLPALFDVEKLGMGMDETLLRKLEVQVERELCERSERVAELAGRKGDDDFNPRSSDQLAEAFERRGADLSFCKTTKTGKKSLDAESLTAIDDDLARAEEARRASETLYTRYVYPALHTTTKRGIDYEPFLAPDGRYHADQNQVGARTGRTSTSPNVQNWPRDDLRMRHLVMADEGKKLVACDLDQIELRLLAAFLGPGKMHSMIIDPDADIHTYAAKMVGLKERDRGMGIVESPRQRGKKFNYERTYGGGVRAIRRWHGVGQKEGKEMLMRWHEAFPEVSELEAKIEFTLFDKGFIRTPWGRRHRPYNRATSDREAYKFVNYLLQGTAGDLFKDSIVRVHKLGIPMIALTHDEILAEVDAAEAEEAGELIVRELIDHPKIAKLVPLGADCNIVDRWSFAKDPNFDPKL